MNTPNEVLIGNAKETLKGNWGLVTKFMLLYLVIGFVLQIIPILNILGYIFIMAPLFIGLTVFWLSISRDQSPPIKELFLGFYNYWRSFGAYWMVVIYVLLWSLLFILPGLYAAYSYALTYFIMADDSAISINDAINKSKLMMKGNRRKLLSLHSRFIGIIILLILLIMILMPILTILLKGQGLLISIIFMGFLFIIYLIMFLRIMPIMWVATAKFYDDIRGEDPSVPSIPDVPLATPLEVPRPTPEAAPIS